MTFFCLWLLWTIFKAPCEGFLVFYNFSFCRVFSVKKGDKMLDVSQPGYSVENRSKLACGLINHSNFYMNFNMFYISCSFSREKYRLRIGRVATCICCQKSFKPGTDAYHGQCPPSCKSWGYLNDVKIDHVRQRLPDRPKRSVWEPVVSWHP